MLAALYARGMIASARPPRSAVTGGVITALLALIALLAAAGSAWAWPSSALVRAGCTPGVKKVGGVQVREFCGGTARATVTVGGKTTTLTGGSCERGSAYLAVNIGTVVLEPGKTVAGPYFGLNVGKLPMVGGAPATKDGTYGNPVVAIRIGGKGLSLRGSTANVTLAGGRTRGTFAGDQLFGGPKVTGTFSC